MDDLAVRPARASTAGRGGAGAGGVCYAAASPQEAGMIELLCKKT